MRSPARSFLTTLLALAACIAVGIAGNPITRGKGKDSATWRTDGDTAVHEEKSSKLSSKPRQLTADEKARLRVEWLGAEPGSHRFSAPVTDPTSTRWTVASNDDRFRDVAVRGRLMLASADGKTSAPVLWPLPVRVLIAGEPGSKPDWSAGHSRKDTLFSDGTLIFSDCLVEKDGTFLASFPKSGLSRQPGVKASHQTGLCLGTQTARQLNWRNDDPLLPGSLGEVEIEGPVTLSPVQQIINAVPSPHSQFTFDPATVIRAVNTLHALGKEQAIAELRQFLKLAWVSNSVKRIPDNIDTSDSRGVYLILLVLFEPVDSANGMPPMRLGGPSPGIPKGDEREWPIHPLTVVDDIPFLLVNGYRLGGSTGPPNDQMEWAAKHGKLRARPLRPADSPLLAAEKLLALPETRRMLGTGMDDYEYGLPLRQAVQAAAEFFPPKQERGGLNGRFCSYKSFFGQPGYDAPADWDACKRKADEIKLHWDPTANKWTAAGAPGAN